MKVLKTCIILIILLFPVSADATNPDAKSRTKFYNFDDMLIDGEIKKPTGLYTDVRARVRFERLLKLKKSFLGPLFDSAKDKVFK